MVELHQCTLNLRSGIKNEVARNLPQFVVGQNQEALGNNQIKSDRPNTSVVTLYRPIVTCTIGLYLYPKK